DSLNCGTANQECDVVGGIAMCTDCVEGYKDVDGGCVQLCPEEGAEGDAGVEDCVYLKCTDDTLCTDMHKTCDDHADAHRTCGEECVAGYTKNADGMCIPEAEFNGCDEGEVVAAQCETEHRVCTDGNPGSCGACLVGYTQNAALNCVPEAEFNGCDE